MRKLPINRLHAKRWLIVDNFAGGGGASTGIELACGRSPDVAINHDPEALAMHEANHPLTRHYATDVFDVDPRVATRNQPVGLAWFSPDCTHHSKARGGKPIRDVGKKSRSLAWVVVRWAEQVRPRVIILENVEEFQEWGPVIHKVGTDGFPEFAQDGSPWYVPCPKRRGKTFRQWVRKLQRLGYTVEWKQLRACDYGAPTIRKRLFVIARCDGEKIVWPEPTHGKPDSPEVKSGKRKPWRTAAEIIDWSIPCPSIFLSPEEAKVLGVIRPLAENTLKRIFAGLKRYVIDAANPFIVCCNHGGDWFRGRGLTEPFATVNGSKGDALVTPFVSVAQHGGSNRDAFVPLHTVTASDKDQNLVVAPYCVPRYGEAVGQSPRAMTVDQPSPTIVPTGNGASLVAPVLSREFGNSIGQSIDSPCPTIMPGGQGKTSLVQAFIAQHNTGMVGHSAEKPLSTITQRGTQQQVVTASMQAAFLSHNYTSNTGGGHGFPDQPVKTVTAGGQHHMAVKAFLQKYYGSEHSHQGCDEPIHTVPTKYRFGIVTVNEAEYEIVDIGMRMLTARELFRAQGFPDTYKIDIPAPSRNTGKVRMLPKDAQVRMCGNSVCPDLVRSLVAANCPWLIEKPASPGKSKARQLELMGV